MDEQKLRFIIFQNYYRNTVRTINISGANCTNFGTILVLSSLRFVSVQEAGSQFKHSSKQVFLEISYAKSITLEWLQKNLFEFCIGVTFT